jgi:hypothetical protein
MKRKRYEFHSIPASPVYSCVLFWGLGKGDGINLQLLHVFFLGPGTEYGSDNPWIDRFLTRYQQLYRWVSRSWSMCLDQFAFAIANDKLISLFPINHWCWLRWSAIRPKRINNGHAMVRINCRLDVAIQVTVCCGWIKSTSSTHMRWITCMCAYHARRSWSRGRLNHVLSTSRQ